ncbi:MAG: hypothetical protein EXX96DRAFT_605969 [Benjaminiella poitrasii]|nr:MAG: hypothetical protein EXX96DRAFT_605969 [Benjaminiella poitrasii]
MGNAFEDLVKSIQNRLHTLFLIKADRDPKRNGVTQSANIPWSWVAVNVAEVLSEYPTGLTETVLLSILEVMWKKAFIKRSKGFDKNFNTIQAVYDSNTDEKFILEVTVKSWTLLHGAKNYQITVIDETDTRELDIYMHPKFNPWITYRCANQTSFFSNRKIRMICPAKANAPITSKYNDEAFPRKYRVALIRPTHLLLLILDRHDQTFVRQEFPDKIRDLRPTQVCRLWLKIIHVETTVHTSTATVDPEQAPKAERTDLYLVDMSSDCVPVVLSLYDQQTELVSIFRRNDYIGLYHPVRQQSVADEVSFECSNETVLFLMPEKEAQEAGLAKVNLMSTFVESQPSLSDPKNDIMERDEEGFMDCSNYLSRIYIKDLTHCMLNVTLYGKVVGLANCNPFIKKNSNGTVQKMDRFALRLADSTGMMDVTLWEDAGRDSRKIKLGQYVLLDCLATSDKHAVGNRQVWYVNGSVVCGTRTFNISTLSCLLTSTSFRSIVPLWHAKETENDQFQVEGTIVGWELYLKSSEDQFVFCDEYTRESTKSIISKVDFMDYSLSARIITRAHGECLLPQPPNKENCDFCGCLVGHDVIDIFRPKPGKSDKYGRDWEGWIEWRLDDGTSQCKFYGGEETLLNITAHNFKTMTHRSQIQLLNSVIGVPILCSLSMKFVLLAGVISALSQVSAVTIVTPWAQSVWTAGGHGEITWNASATDATLKCDIYMLNGDFKNSNIVAQITDPATPVDCSAGKYDMYPLNDFASGQYWIRIGQASTGNWAYSSAFQFNGNGTSKPQSVVQPIATAAGNGTTVTVPTPVAATNGTNNAANKPVLTASGTTAKPSSIDANKSATSATPDSGASMVSINTAAVALGAIAAMAFAL